jgi:ubiquitin C-terminal hydrolase
MQVYDPKFVPDVCGFMNSGVICYLNTLVQTLLSLPAFNEHMLVNKSTFVTAASKGNTIGLLYIKLLEENNISLDANGTIRRLKSNTFSINQCNASSLLRGLIDLRKKNKNSSNLLHHQQESCSEGLIFVLEALTDVDPTIADLFNIRYKMDIKCRVCDDVKAGPQEKSNVTFQLFEEDPILQESLTSKAKIEDYIQRHINIPEDYKCENCKAENKITVENGVKTMVHSVTQYYRLVRISTVIILVFNKYQEKKVKFFPDSLDFKATNGNLHYELITQVEHFGTRHGGHYYTKCKRPTPEGFAQFVASKTRVYHDNELQQLEHQRKLIVRKMKAAEQAAGAVSSELVKRLHLIDQKIENARGVEEPIFDNDVVFQLNDSSVSVDPNGFKPTKNTYIAVYHLV